MLWLMKKKQIQHREYIQLGSLEHAYLTNQSTTCFSGFMRIIGEAFLQNMSKLFLTVNCASRTVKATFNQCLTFSRISTKWFYASNFSSITPIHTRWRVNSGDALMVSTSSKPYTAKLQLWKYRCFWAKPASLYQSPPHHHWWLSDWTKFYS